MAPGADPERRSRSWIAAPLGDGEFLIDTALALALICGGTILLGVVVYDFVRGLGHEPVVGQVLGLLSGLLCREVRWLFHSRPQPMSARMP